MGYDIKLFRDNIRFLEILGGREGGGGITSALFFDGKVNFFKELPKPDDTLKLMQVQAMLREIRKE